MTHGGPAADTRRRVELPAAPGLGGLYLRGAAHSVRLAARARLGRSAGPLPPVEHVVRDVTVDPAHLTAYQHAVGETASDVLPAGFVHVLAFPVATAVLARPDAPLPLAGMVHLANRVHQARALRLGEHLDVRAHAEGLRPHRSGARVDLVTEVRASGSDEVAWREVSTLLARGVRLPGAPGDGVAGEDGRRRRDFVPPVPTGRWVLGADTGRRYAAVSGDRNPIHLSRPAARAFGFPRAVAHGMDTAARALAAVGPARGEAFDWTVDFATPVLLPATVAVRVAPRADGPGFDLAVWSPRTGAPHLTGAVVPV